SEFAGSERSTEIVEAESVRDAAQWIEDIEKLLSEGKRAEAIDSLEAFRLEYPGYELPPNLLSLLPSASDE
ncbi:MAG: hypothetical protein GTO41_19405, partial [Burkholderiales bacterium]|nr:hypothetical protein [Burkholderiales bacterium]